MKFKRALPAIALAMAAILAPPPPLVHSAWMADNLIVPDGPRAGERWDPSLTPYVAPIVDALAPESPHNVVVVRKSAQTGLSVAGIGFVGGSIDLDPCDMGYAQPTIDALQEFNRTKLMRSIEQSPSMRPRSRCSSSRPVSGNLGRSTPMRRRRFVRQWPHGICRPISWPTQPT